MAVQIKKNYLLGDFQLEPNNHALKREGAPVPLSRKRFLVLLYLIERRNQLVTRQELLAQFWDGSEVYEENLTKCISEIRKALNDQRKPHRFIETVPAIGYRYMGPLVEQAFEYESAVFETEMTRGVKIVVEDEDDEVEHGRRSEAIIYAHSPVDPVSLPAPKRSSWTLPIVLAIGLIALTASTLILYRQRTQAQPPENPPGLIPTIAVLPFKPLAADSRNESLELGMADTLINRLSPFKQLIVRPISQVRKYTGLEQNPIAAGRELGVDYVLEGNLQVVGEKTRATVRLLRVKDGSAIWTDTCDQECSTIFQLEDAIAERIAGALALQLTSEQKKQLTRHYTDNPEAYQLYLKGRFYWNKYTDEGFLKSIDYFKQAVDKDPGYGLAYSGLADSYSLLGEDGTVPPRESFPQARAYAEKALKLDETLNRAHLSLGIVKLFYDWNVMGAEKELRRAKELDPNDAQAYHFYGHYLQFAGQQEEARNEMKRGLELDPTNLILNAELGMAYNYMRQYDPAIAQFRKTLELDPNFVLVSIWIAQALEQQGKYQEALAELNRAKTVEANWPWITAEIGCVDALLGKRAEAQKIIHELNERRAREYIDPGLISDVYIALGNKDQAFVWLERAYQERAGATIPWIEFDPKFDPLRSDPRFANLLQRIGLPQ